MVKTTDSEWLKTKLLSMQRWEDEGGHMIENRDSIPNRPIVQLVPIRARRHVTSLQWNKRFVIEPFQPGTGILREDIISKGKLNG